MSAKFIDATGESWTIKIAFGELVALRKRLDLCLIDLTDEDRQAKRSKADIARLTDNIELMVNMIFVLCEKQAEERGLNDIDFAGRLDGEAIATALAAVQEELAVFFLPRSTKERGRTVTRRQAEIITGRATTLIAAKLAPLEKDPVSEAELEDLDRIIAGAESDSSESPGKSPA